MKMLGEEAHMAWDPLILQGTSFQNIGRLWGQGSTLQGGSSWVRHVPSCRLRPLLSSEQPWGRRIEGPKGAESWVPGSRAPSRGIRGSEISVPREKEHGKGIPLTPSMSHMCHLQQCSTKGLGEEQHEMT